jgi:hypothetical protein
LAVLIGYSYLLRINGDVARVGGFFWVLRNADGGFSKEIEEDFFGMRRIGNTLAQHARMSTGGRATSGTRCRRTGE